MLFVIFIYSILLTAPGIFVLGLLMGRDIGLLFHLPFPMTVVLMLLLGTILAKLLFDAYVILLLGIFGYHYPE